MKNKQERSTFRTAIIPTLVIGLCSAANANSAERYVVKYKQGWDGNSTLTSEMSTIARDNRVYNNRKHVEKFGGQFKRTLGRINAVAVELTAKQVEQLQASEMVEYVEIDPKRAIFNPVPMATDITPMAESTPYGITMVQADQLSDNNIGSMKVCITDTGYDGDHEDLRSYQGSGISGDDNDGNGNDTGNWYQDGHGHGTHVAGTISAIGGNGVGVVGVSSSDLVGLHIVKVFNNSGNWGYGSDMAAAVGQCVDAGANVVSMSLGGSSSSNSEQNAFDDAYNNGVLLIAASGNDGTSSGNDALSYPASYDSVMSVAAIDSSKSVASWSQKNSQVEIAAPGVSINSTLPNDTYEAWSGTSMATPHVSAVAALVWSHFPSCTNAQMRDALNASAEDLGSNGWDQSYGNGLVLAKDAYDYLTEFGCEGDTGGGGGGGTGEGELNNGDSVSSLSGSSGDELNYYIDVPAGATNLVVTTTGGSGDADLYVRFGAAPTTNNYDCRPYINGNEEECDFASPSEGRYYIMLRGYSAFSGVSLSVSYDEDNGGGGSNGDSFEYTDLSASRRDWVYHTVEIPAGMSSFSVSISGGSGDADLYVRDGAQVSTSSYDCRPYLNGNEETCSFTNPGAGTWYIGVRAYRAFSGLTLSGSYE
ncbi:S8 family serine peptidase [Aliikangiella coralliicola]|uniref:S8 family serine peptidase n=1 Tax=Aliikangiella coralliicola TaxID=2592383 RepID=A0A545UFV6_9GAMM|nr:S8 family serine peptidase [Aliikangiella coralliicola]TQV88325.1 S8 family serine peptidase [Aliikangiella coralliicola]